MNWENMRQKVLWMVASIVTLKYFYFILFFYMLKQACVPFHCASQSHNTL